MTPRDLWQRYQTLLLDEPSLGFRLDLSRMGFGEEALSGAEAADRSRLRRDGRARAGRDRQPRREAHGRPLLAARARAGARRPRSPPRSARPVERVRDFAAAVHDGRRQPPRGRALPAPAGDRHRRLGARPAVRGRRARRARPTACSRTSSTTPTPTASTACSRRLGGALGETLAVVISKSGGTPETRNGMLEAAAAYERAGLDFGHARRRDHRRGQRARPTGASSRAGSSASRCGTGSAGAPRVTSRGRAAAGGAAGDRRRRDCSRAPRRWTTSRAGPTRARNPAALLALAWHAAGDGRGAKDMVVLPYKDRLLLFSRYLQQLVMESLGKEHDLDGQRRAPGHRGLRQQGLDRPARLRAAAARRRAELLRDLHRGAARSRGRRASRSSRASPAATTSTGFFLGTRRALYENGRAVDHASRSRDVDAAQPRDADRALRARGRALRERSSASTPTTSRASRRARRRRRPCSSCSGRLLAALVARGARGGTCEELAAEAAALPTRSRPCSTSSSGSPRTPSAAYIAPGRRRSGSTPFAASLARA